MLRSRRWKTPVSKSVAASWLVVAAMAFISTESLSQTDRSSSSGLSPQAGQADGMLARARFLQEQADHEQAIPILREALQSSRMTLGLYHENQLEILDGLIASEIAQENWRRADDLFALLLHLYENLYADDPERLEQGLAKVTGWHVDAFRLDLDGRAVPHLRSARKLLKARLQLARLVGAPDVGKIARLREGIHVAEANLILHSDSNRNELRSQQALRREWLLSSLE